MILQYKIDAENYPVSGTTQPATLHRYRGGEFIPLYLDTIWVVQRGGVCVRTLQLSGIETLLALVGPQAAFAPRLSCSEAYSAQALDKTELLRLSWQEVHSSPQLTMETNRRLAGLLLQMEALHAIQKMPHAFDKLCSFLALLAEHFGQPQPGGFRLPVRLTHEWLAAAIGCERVTVTRYLGELQAASLLKSGRDRHLFIGWEIAATFC